MDTTKLDRLIVEHLNDLDSAGKRIYEIEQRLWRDIAKVVERWAKSKAWTGSFDVDDEIWVAPRQWIAEDEFQARFYLDWGPNDTGQGIGEEPLLDLSRLCGVAGGQLCLWRRPTIIASG